MILTLPMNCITIVYHIIQRYEHILIYCEQFLRILSNGWNQMCELVRIRIITVSWKDIQSPRFSCSSMKIRDPNHLVYEINKKNAALILYSEKRGKRKKKKKSGKNK